MSSLRRRTKKRGLSPIQVSFIAGVIAIIAGVIAFHTLPFMYAMGVAAALFVVSFFI